MGNVLDAILIGFLVYLSFILGLGIYASRLTKNMKDFALGGQRLGPILIAFSERASGESAWLLLGLPGAALAAGLLELWTVVGCIAGIMFSWLVIAKPLRMATEKLGAITLPELFELRFKDKTGSIRLIASLIITFLIRVRATHASLLQPQYLQNVIAGKQRKMNPETSTK